ncbi:hypothetical protein MXB_627 [Myxobolus squamalis]|nr:hypothetical protein MXB_627 [Myxobolus squamalis]
MCGLFEFKGIFKRPKFYATFRIKSFGECQSVPDLLDWLYRKMRVLKNV